MLEVFLRFDPTKHDVQNLNAVGMRGHFEKKKPRLRHKSLNLSRT